MDESPLPAGGTEPTLPTDVTELKTLFVPPACDSAEARLLARFLRQHPEVLRDGSVVVLPRFDLLNVRREISGVGARRQWFAVRGLPDPADHPEYPPRGGPPPSRGCYKPSKD